LADESPPNFENRCSAGYQEGLVDLETFFNACTYQIDKEGIYFITFTCIQWISLIALSNGYNAAYKFFAAEERCINNEATSPLSS
jgi:hypothetical protein